MVAAVVHPTPPLKTEADFTRAFLEGPHRLVDVGYADLATWSFGQGPDLVFIHGWPLWSATYRRLAPLLARDFRLHFFDLPGAGKSITRDLARVNLKDHISASAAVIRALGLEKYALLAHDSGGAIARILAARDPKVTALVLGNTELPNHIPWQVKIYVAMARFGLGPLLGRSMKLGAIRRSPLGFGGCFENTDYVEGEFGRLLVDPLNAPGGFDGQLALAKNLKSSDLGDLTAVHRSIACPTLCIWGEKDPFFPLAGAREMIGEFGGGARLEVIPRGKLFVHEDHADTFAQLARGFLTTPKNNSN